MKKTLILTSLLIVAVGLSVLAFKLKDTLVQKPPVACTMEAKLCPDGSYVGRTGPKCEFTECPSPISIGTGTIEGTMTIGPICPVERIDQPCNPTPEMYAAHKVFVYTPDKTKIIATLIPNAQGNFSATLLAGSYIVDVTHQSIGFIKGAPQNIKITSGQITTIIINIDTGIR